jgi:hypothetical protein
MAPPKGNKFWESRSKHGRDRLFATPDDLLKSAVDYFQWADENPWVTKKIVQSDANGTTIEEKPTQRPYSRKGWYHFIHCSTNWLSEFKKTCSNDFLEVINTIEDFIDNQQWEGATVGTFNANIISRTLGLKDNTDITTQGEKIQPNTIQVEIVRPNDDDE